MSSFENCQRVYLEGGVNDGEVIPVDPEMNSISFMVKGGREAVYRRSNPLRWRHNHIVFEVVA